MAEQPFVLGIDADELYKGESLEETVLVQGIIDVWFEEDGELVVWIIRQTECSKKRY